MKRLPAVCSLIPAAALVIGFVIGPLLLLLRVSLYAPASGRGFYTPGTATLANYAAIADWHVASIAGFTVAFGLAVAAIVIAVAYPLSLFLTSLSSHLQTLALGLILIPKTAGLLAALFGLQRWLPRGLLAAIVAEVYLVLPYSVLILYIQLRGLDSRLGEAARGLGANSWQVFRRVTFPLSGPGLTLAFQISFMWGLGAFLGPLFLGGPSEMTLAGELHRQAFEYGRWPLAASEAVALLGLVAVAALGVPRILKRWSPLV